MMMMGSLIEHKLKDDVGLLIEEGTCSGGMRKSMKKKTRKHEGGICFLFIKFLTVYQQYN